MYENLLSKEQKRIIEGPFTNSQIEGEKKLYFKYLKDKYHMRMSDIVLIPKPSNSDFGGKIKKATFKSKINGMDKVEIDMNIGHNNSFVEFELKAFKVSALNLH